MRTVMRTVMDDTGAYAVTDTMIRVAKPRWGLTFDQPGTVSEGLPLHLMPVPDELIVPLHQHAGLAALPLVSAGDSVLKGEPIGMASATGLGTRIHAPTSGTVTAVGPHLVPGRGESLCVHIRADQQDRRWAGYQPVAEPARESTPWLRQAIAEAGIVGLGGAAFPANIKLNPGIGIETLLLNGVECEPGIDCDNALMQNRAAHILLGAQIMLRILETDSCIIAVKSNASAAIASMQNAMRQLGDDRLRLALVPPVYPAGSEAQLVKLVTGREIPAGGLPWDAGIVCQNVATAAAMARFFTLGEPLISRIVTVTGTAIAAPANIEARLGTSIGDLLEFAGGYAPVCDASTAVQLSMGGPMMGTTLPADTLPLTKACNCILAEIPADLAQPAAELPCIRCGDCATVCPVDLTPQMLLQARRMNDFEKLQQLGLSDCIECGCCDYVCPSHIELTATFVRAKQTLWEIGFERRRARKAEARFKARSARLEQNRQQLEQELNNQIETLDATGGNTAKALQELLERTGQRGGGTQK
jgi:electron transport complex protein RnfC